MMALLKPHCEVGECCIRQAMEDLNHIRCSITETIKQAKNYSTLWDEVVDISSKEQVSVAGRFIDSSCNIGEEVLDLISTERITGEALAHAIKETRSSSRLSR